MWSIRKLISNNRSEAQRTVFDSKEEFRSKHIKSFDYLENEEYAPNQIFLYDFSDFYITLSGGIVIPIPRPENQFQNTNNFIDWFRKYFHKEARERQKVLIEVATLLEEQLKEYINRLTPHSKVVPEEKRHCILQWEELTNILLWEIFCKEYSQNPDQDYTLCRDILQRSLWGISRCKEDFLYPQERFNSSTIVLYNFWGESYAKERAGLLKNHLNLSENEKAFINIDENKEFFNLKYCTEFEEKVCTPGMQEAYYLSNEIQALSFLEDLFNDYVKRLRQSGLYDETRTFAAIENWEMVTKGEIKRVALIDKISKVLFSKKFKPTLDFRDAKISIEEYKTIIRIESLADKCFSKIDGLVNDYISLVKNERLVQPWSDTLAAQRIDYRGLYSDLREKKVISPDFEFTAFEDSFRSADFSLMMESARYMDTLNRGMGNAGCIQQLIKYVGGRVGNEWYCLAAESSYSNSTGTNHKGENAKKAIDKLKPTKRFSDDILKIYISRIHG